MTTELKLTMELVPSTSWNMNMRAALPPAMWDTLRKQVYAQYQHRCGICRGRGRLHCHEVWQYDDETHVQTLAGLMALCELCHHVKHIGHAGILASQGALDYATVVAHFMRVNQCDRATFERHYAAAMAQWQARSRYDWDVDMGL